MKGYIKTLHENYQCFLIKKTNTMNLSTMYKRDVVGSVKNQIEMSATATHLQLRTPPNENFEHFMKAKYLSMLERRSRQIICPNGLQQVLSNDDSRTFPKSFAGCFEIYSG